MPSLGQAVTCSINGPEGALRVEGTCSQSSPRFPLGISPPPLSAPLLGAGHWGELPQLQ